MTNLPMIPTSVPLSVSQDMPEFLRTTGKQVVGLEGLNKEDFKLPELKLLQGGSPEIDAFPGLARKNEFWHTGVMKNFGPRLKSIVAVSRKRIILWRPKTDNGGGILAVSDDGANWKMGGNKQFTVMLKGAKKPVIWDTKGNVAQSGLTNFGTSDPENDQSAPAAMVYFEYLLYLPEYENASPVLLRLKSTALDNGRDLNTYFLLQGKSVFAHVIDWIVEGKSGGGNDWTIPRPMPAGWVADKTTYNLMEDMHANYASKMADLVVDQDDEMSIKPQSSMSDDEIKY